MKDSSNRLIFGATAVCLLAVVVCLIIGFFQKRERQKAARSESRPTAVERGPRIEPAERRAPITAGAPCPEEKSDSAESPGEAEEFDISGIVIDKNGDPIEEASVSAFFYSLNDFFAEGDRDIVSQEPGVFEKKTKEDGRFGFKYQTRKRCSLTVRKEDYIPEARELSSPQKDMIITLILGGAIEGNVVDAITSKPLDKFRIVRSVDTGSGAGIISLEKKEEDIYLPTRGKQFDDPDGKFRLSGLQKGRYRLTSLAEGYAQSSVRGIEVELEKTTTGVIIEQQPASGIRGHVVDAIGKPIEGAKISQRNPLHSPLFGELSFSQQKTLATTDSKGEFEIGGLPAGAFTLEARHEDYCPAEQNVAVNKGEVTEGVEFQLLQGGRISGVVLARADWQPVADAEIRAATGPALLMRDDGETKCTTDQTGSFDLVKLEPGTYSLVVTASNFATETVEGMKLNENEVIADLIIQLSQGGSVVGTVRDHSGKAMSNLRVCAVGARGEKDARTDEEGNYAIRNLKEGEYLVAAVQTDAPLGMPTTLTQEHLVQIENDKETRLDIVVGGPLKVYGKITHSGEPQRGLMVAIESSYRSVVATHSTASATDMTDEDGQYEFQNLRRGLYTLTVLRVGRTMPRRLFDTELELRDSDFEKNIDLPKGGVSGRVLDANNGKPVEGAKVTLERKQAMDPREAALSKLSIYVGAAERTDPEGRYSFSILEDGIYFAVASKEGYAAQGLTADVRNGQGLTNLDFHLSAGETLSGRVTGNDPSQPVQEVLVSVRDMGGRTVYSDKTTLAEEGGYETARLSPGEYMVTIDAPAYASASKRVEIQAGAHNGADFVLAEGGTLIIRALDERGRPVQGICTSVMDERGDFALRFFPDLKELLCLYLDGMSREDGLDITQNLPQGRYQVEVGALGYEDQVVNVSVQEGEKTTETITLRKAR
jgi:uncharacterized GH25 family protein